MKLSKKTFFISALALLTSGCNNASHPDKNKDPQYFVTISGHINPSLSKPIYLAFWARYAGFNPKCKVTINRFEGVDGMPAKTHFYKPNTNAQGDYVIKIPIDYYISGRCDWKLSEVDMTMSFKKIDPNYAKNPWNWQIIVFGSSKNGLPGLPVNKDFTATLNGEQCIKKGFNLCGNLLMANTSHISVIQNKNYHLVQNIN